jgi:hypothetical protein
VSPRPSRTGHYSATSPIQPASWPATGWWNGTVPCGPPKNARRSGEPLRDRSGSAGHVRARLSIVHDVEHGGMARRSHLKAEAFKRVGLARAKPTVAAGDRTPPISSHDSRTFGRPDEARESVATASGANPAGWGQSLPSCRAEREIHSQLHALTSFRTGANLPWCRLSCASVAVHQAYVRSGRALPTVQREAVHETRLDEGNEAADGDEEGPLVDDEVRPHTKRGGEGRRRQGGTQWLARRGLLEKLPSHSNELSRCGCHRRRRWASGS